MDADKSGLHLIKLSVGTESVEGLADWQERRRAYWKTVEGRAIARHITRMTPRRGDEILDGGGSIYWVVKGFVQARQRILALEPAPGAGGRPSCAILLDDALVRVVPRAHRPFQGWRYLRGEDAPPDLPPGYDAEGDSLPPRLAAELSELGLL